MHYRNELMLFQHHEDYLAALKPCVATRPSGTLCNTPDCLRDEIILINEITPG